MYEPLNLPRRQSQTPAAGELVPREAARETGRMPPAGDLMAIIDRLDQVVQDETAALNQRGVADLSNFTRKKSQILLEVTRLTRMMGNPTGDAQLSDRLTRLKANLAVNRDTLEIHLRAARQLSDLIAGAAREAESDGTYSAVGSGHQ